MKTLALVFGLTLSATSAFAQVYSDSQDLPREHSNFRLSDATYWLIPTRTETVRIPGCREDGEISRVCTETRVLESKPVVKVEVEYKDGINPHHENRGRAWTYFYMATEKFPEADIAKLAANTSLWDFTGRKARVRKAFVQKHLSLSAKKEPRTIQVVDVRNSRLCHEGESGRPLPGCVEDIQYRPATTIVNALKITIK